MNHHIFTMWRDAYLNHGPDSILGRAPKFVIDPQPTRLAFASLNPAFVENPQGIDQEFARWMHDHGIPYPQAFYWNENTQLGQAQDFVAVAHIAANMAESHRRARHHHEAHFRRVNGLAEYLGVQVDDYAHLDIYLWLTTYSRQLAAQRQNYPTVAHQQEDVFFSLLAQIHPTMLAFLYSGAGNIFQTLCAERNGVALENVNQTDVMRCFNLTIGQGVNPIRVIIPRGGSIPNSRGMMSNANFQLFCQQICQQWEEIN